MLDAIALLGKLKYRSDPEELIRGLVRKQSFKQGETYHYVELHFSTLGKPFSVAVSEYATEEPFATPLKLNYVGIVPASGLQFHATGHDLRHLCSQVLPALLDKLPEHSPLAERIRHVLDQHFVLDADNPKDRYRYLLNVEGMGRVEPGFTAGLMERMKLKERPAAVAKEIVRHIEQTFFVPQDHILLYTICIDGEPIARDIDYIQAALDDQVSMFSKVNESVCYLTGKRDRVSADLTKFKFKYYITDKMNFSSGISGKFENNFQLSEQAAWRVLLGERYVMNHLRLRIGDFNVYLIPEFLENQVYDYTKIEKAIRQAAQKVQNLRSLKWVHELDKKLFLEQTDLKELHDIETGMLLNFLFYEENKNEMKVFRHIKDVTPSYLSEMEQTRQGVVDQFKKTAPHYRFFAPSLESLFYYIPLEVDSKGKVKNPQQLMQICDAMLSGRRIDRRGLVQSFTKLLSSIHHRSFGGLQIGRKWKAGDEREAERLWCRVNWEQQQLILWLEQIGVIEGGEVQMSITLSEKLDKEQEHIRKSGFDETKTALFLLGCAVNKIADAQELELKSRPILRKINFRGMTMDAVRKLAVEVFEKGAQYKNVMKSKFFYSKFELYYQDMTKFLAAVEERGNKKLNESDHVFYILCGYSFANALKAGAHSSDAPLEETDNLIDQNMEEAGNYE